MVKKKSQQRAESDEILQNPEAQEVWGHAVRARGRQCQDGWTQQHLPAAVRTEFNWKMTRTTTLQSLENLKSPPGLTGLREGGRVRAHPRPRGPRIPPWPKLLLRGLMWVSGPGKVASSPLPPFPSVSILRNHLKANETAWEQSTLVTGTISYFSSSDDCTWPSAGGRANRSDVQCAVVDVLITDDGSSRDSFWL